MRLTDEELLAKLTREQEKLQAELEKRKANLNARTRRVRSRIAGRERKTDTRRKILVGSMVLSRVEEHPDTCPALLADLDAYLDRDRDRLLFDLPPKPAAAE